MGNSREASPDWLREFEPPKQFFATLSSDSEDAPTNSLAAEYDINSEEQDTKNIDLSKSDQNQDAVLIDSEEDSPVTKTPKSKSSNTRAKSATQKRKGETQKQKGDGVKEENMKEEILEKRDEPHVSSSLPLMMSDKVQRSKALVECEGESIDMSGDVGAVGRVVITDPPSGDPEMLLDLKGTIYKTTIVPSRTFCVVSFNQSEAKIEAVMNDFIQLKELSNVYEAETMIEGTLDGFSFDSDEENVKVPKPNAPQDDQNNEANGVNNGKKTKGKAAKALGVTRKKGKPAGKPPKKTQKRAQAPKKAKNAKK